MDEDNSIRNKKTIYKTVAYKDNNKIKLLIEESKKNNDNNSISNYSYNKYDILNI